MEFEWRNRGAMLLSVLLVAAVPMAQTLEKPPPAITTESDVGLDAGIAGPEALWPGPDGFGYTGQTVAYDWIEISTTGTAIAGLDDDSYLGPFPIGFSFSFYGTDYTEFYVASNGYISFGAGSSSLSNQCPLPTSTSPDNLIALMWDDLDPGDTGDLVYYQTFDPCPVGSGACLVVQYDDFCHFPGGASCAIAGTFEAILFADTGNVILQYEDAGAEEGSSSTEGIEGGDFAAGHGLTYDCNAAASVADGTAIEFQFPAGLNLLPDAAENEGCEGADVTYTLTLANYSGADGTFALTYSSVWPISGPADLFVANLGAVDFDVVVSIPWAGISDIASVTASGNGYSDVSTLTTSSTAGGLLAWESIADINGVGRSRPAAAAADGKVYLVGGEISGGRADTVEEFDPATGIWTTQTGLMPIPASNVCAAAIGTDIYVPGGYDVSGTYLTALQVYHTTTDTWETVTSDPLPAPRSGPGCAALDGKLYVFGGTDGTYQSTAFVYDPALAAGTRWSALPDMSYPRAYIGGVAVNGKVYAVGGRDSGTADFAYVEAFDPVDGLWHTVTSMNTPRGGPGAMFWQELLVVCAGGWGSYLNSCESYDTTQGYAGAWTNLSQTMITGRRTYGYASLPDGLYAVAGFNGSFLTAAERMPVLICPGQPPDIDVTPASLVSSLLIGTTDTQQLTIANTGEGALDWEIFEEEGTPGSVEVALPAGPAQAPDGTAVAAGSFTPRPERSYTVEPGRVGSRAPPNVLLAHADDGAASIQALLQAYGDLGAVDTYDCRSVTPSLGELSAYDVVLTWSNYVYGDPAAMGNVLADYVDAGGKVISLMFAMGTHGWNMQGRFMDEGYTAMDGTGILGTNACLGTHNPAHPIMAGVTDVCDVYRLDGTYLTAGSSEVAQWDDGQLFVAVKDDHSVVSMAGYVGDNFLWTGQMPDVVHNAILWLVEMQECTDLADVPWLSASPTTGSTPAGGTTPVDVTFDATGVPVGIYNALLCVFSNDPDEPVVPVPVTMEVVIPVELMGISVE